MMRVAVVGLGAMGGRMARRLAVSGHDVVGWNRSVGADIEGVGRAGTPRAAAAQADVVITMVSDDAALRAIADGVLAGIGTGATLIQMSTVDPETVAWLSGRLPDGARMLDVPVLGSVAEADQGKLVLLTGGDDEAVRACAPVLDALGTAHRVGGVGTGTAAKLVANSSLFGVIGVLAESLVLARGLGLSHEAAFGVLARTPLAAQAERRKPAVESGAYEPRFALDMALKDSELVRRATESLGIDLRIAEAMRHWFADASGAGLGDRDYTAVLGHIGARP